jgi:hypothetical protein
MALNVFYRQWSKMTQHRFLFGFSISRVLMTIFAYYFFDHFIFINKMQFSKYFVLSRLMRMSIIVVFSHFTEFFILSFNRFSIYYFLSLVLNRSYTFLFDALLIVKIIELYSIIDLTSEK